MILFTIYDLFKMKVYYGGGRKNPENEKDETKEKRFSPFGCPPIPPSTKMEADCFPVSENTENKPDLPYVGQGPESSGAKKYRVGRGMGQ